MKRYIAPALAAMFVANAAFADVPEQLLYLRQVRVSDVVVNLPTLQKTDGSVCMSYLSSTSRDSAGRLNIRVDQICDSWARRANLCWLLARWKFGRPTYVRWKLFKTVTS